MKGGVSFTTEEEGGKGNRNHNQYENREVPEKEGEKGVLTPILTNTTSVENGAIEG